MIRKIAPIETNWVVTTIAGLKGSVGRQDGTNSAARFWNPYGVAIDGGGCVYVTDAGNHTIRKTAPAGTNWVVTTIGGVGTAIGVSDVQGNDDGIGSAARFAWPTALAGAGDGRVYVADYWNNTVRQETPVWPVMESAELDGETVHLRWTSVAGWQYQLQAVGDLKWANWANVGNAISATNEVVRTQDSVSGNAERYYRVIQLP